MPTLETVPAATNSTSSFSLSLSATVTTIEVKRVRRVNSGLGMPENAPEQGAGRSAVYPIGPRFADVDP